MDYYKEMEFIIILQIFKFSLENLTEMLSRRKNLEQIDLGLPFVEFFERIGFISYGPLWPGHIKQ